MAGTIPREFIDQLVARSDIVEIIDSHVPLKKKGANFTACCPFHDEKTPSFSVSPAKQIFHCFGCGVSGNVIGFLIDYAHYGFVESIEHLAHLAGVEVVYEQNSHQQNKPRPQKDLYHVMQAAAEFYQRQLSQSDTADKAIDYLKNRGLSGKIAKHYGLGYAPPGWDNLIQAMRTTNTTQRQLIDTGMVVEKDNGRCYDRFRDRVMFPIRDKQGRVIAFGGRVFGDDTPKYLNSPETSIFYKGRELYGLYEVLQFDRNPQQFVIVEGYMDVIALAQQGINFAVATLGTATTQAHLRQLIRYSKTITFCFDGDRAGREAAWRALQNSLPIVGDGVDLRFIFLPDGDDPDSVVRREGRDAFLQLVQQAQRFGDVFFNHLSQSIDLNSMAGKSQLIQSALPLIAQMPKSALQLMLLEDLGRQVRINADRLESMMQEPRPVTATKQQLDNEKDHSPLELTKHIRLALALLLQNPGLLSEVEVEHDIMNNPDRGYRLLGHIIAQIRKYPELTPARLLEFWRDNAAFSTLTELVNWQHHVPETGILAELKGAFSRINQQQQADRVTELMQKAKLSELTDEERRQLQSLILANKNTPILNSDDI